MPKTTKSLFELKCAVFHGLHGHVIIYCIDPLVYEILPQMFRGGVVGGGGTFFLGYVNKLPGFEQHSINMCIT